MAMTVMKVGVMRMPVNEAGVHVPMGMRAARRIVPPMPVPVVLVVFVPMLVPHRLVGVHMHMPFGQVEP